MKRLELFTKYKLMFHASDFKLVDAEYLFEYLSNNENSILLTDEVKYKYGGDILRLSSLILEFEQSGLIKVLKRDCYGRIVEFSYNKG